MNLDPHAVLGVPRGVSLAALKAAFRSRARATHPDHGGDRAEFEAVVAAFEALRPAACEAPLRSPASHAYGRPRPAAPRFCAYDSTRPRPAASTRRPAPDFGAVLADVLARQAA
jgi:hypothetical protein